MIDEKGWGGVGWGIMINILLQCLPSQAEFGQHSGLVVHYILETNNRSTIDDGVIFAFHATTPNPECHAPCLRSRPWALG
jgi:hypothetical protein